MSVWASLTERAEVIDRSSVISVSSEAADVREQKQHNSQTVSAAAQHDKSRRNTSISPHTGCLEVDKIKMVDAEVRTKTALLLLLPLLQDSNWFQWDSDPCGLILT